MPSLTQKVIRETLDNYFKWMLLVIAFLYYVFDPNVGIAYIVIIIVDYAWYTGDRHISYPMNRGPQTNKKALLNALVALAAFLAASYAILSVYSPGSLAVAKTSVQSVFHLLASSTPLLRDSPVLTFVTWALIIPIVETSLFFGSLLEGYAEYAGKKLGFRIPLEKVTVETTLVIVSVIFTFVLFHIIVKNLQTTALVITGIFALISCILVIRDKERKSAILFHVFVNAPVVLATLGYL